MSTRPFTSYDDLENILGYAKATGRTMCLAGARFQWGDFQRNRLSDKQQVVFYPEDEVHPADFSLPFGVGDVVVTMSPDVVNFFPAEDVFYADGEYVYRLKNAAMVRPSKAGDVWKSTWRPGLYERD